MKGCILPPFIVLLFTVARPGLSKLKTPDNLRSIARTWWKGWAGKVGLCRHVLGADSHLLTEKIASHPVRLFENALYACPSTPFSWSFLLLGNDVRRDAAYKRENVSSDSGHSLCFTLSWLKVKK